MKWPSRFVGSVRDTRRRIASIAPVVSLLVLVVGAAEAVQLEQPRITGAGGAPLANASGTVRIEQPGVTWTAADPIPVPEPAADWRVGAGVGLLVLLERNRRRRGRHQRGRCALRLGGRAMFAVLAWSSLAVPPALARVPHQAVFAGRLTDDLGVPLTGPVDLELRIIGTTSDCCTDNSPGSAGCSDDVCEAAVCSSGEVSCCYVEWDAICANQATISCGSLCTPIVYYTEEHFGVALDPTGAFSVVIGTGGNQNPYAGAFSADLMNGLAASLEVVVDGDVLSPVVPLLSVPFALVAEHAQAIVRPPTAPRFENCSDGTVADHATGLVWEVKTGAPGTDVNCDVATCADPHDVNNQYTLTGTVPPSGAAVTSFLARLNGEFTPGTPTGCFADTCDWRFPKIAELQTILTGPDAAPGQATVCSSPPCVDPAFDALAWPTAAEIYAAPRTTTTGIWHAHFESGLVDTGTCNPCQLRAVRTGVCR